MISASLGVAFACSAAVRASEDVSALEGVSGSSLGKRPPCFVAECSESAEAIRFKCSAMSSLVDADARASARSACAISADAREGP